MYVFLGIDVDNQFSEIKNKAEQVDKSIDFENSCFALPLNLWTCFLLLKSIIEQFEKSLF